MKLMLYSAFLLLFLVVVIHFLPGLMFRSMPKGLCDGSLNKHKPNWVSSLVSVDDSHYIKPLEINSIQQLETSMKNAKLPVTIVESDDAHLIGYRQSRIFNFVDWICIKVNGEVSSTATIGHSDFGKNRELVEQIRTALKS